MEGLDGEQPEDALVVVCVLLIIHDYSMYKVEL